MKTSHVKQKYLQFSIFCKYQNPGVIKLFESTCIPEFQQGLKKKEEKMKEKRLITPN